MDALLHAPVQELGTPGALDSIDWSRAVVIAPDKTRGNFSGKRMVPEGPYLIITER